MHLINRTSVVSKVPRTYELSAKCYYLGWELYVVAGEGSEVIYSVQNCLFVDESVAWQSCPVDTFIRSSVLVVVFAFLQLMISLPDKS